MVALLLLAGCGTTGRSDSRLARLYSSDRATVRAVLAEWEPTYDEAREIMAAAYHYALSDDPDQAFLNTVCIEHLAKYPRVAVRIARSAFEWNAVDDRAVYLVSILSFGFEDHVPKMTNEFAPKMLVAYPLVGLAGRSHIAGYFLDREFTDRGFAAERSRGARPSRAERG
ncbi:MAG: hypothetical protein KIS66_06910 [Fimbriimonadaceae bacterium]|nr:hypothetical protein [Fimbriimonadaceae bacterium]